MIHCNAQMTPALIREHCQLDEKCLTLLQKAMTKLDLSARAYDRILKVARTIADYEGCENISSTHIAEAISYRNLDRSNWGQGKLTTLDVKTVFLREFNHDKMCNK